MRVRKKLAAKSKGPLRKAEYFTRLEKKLAAQSRKPAEK